jgi:hypothetical protein
MTTENNSPPAPPSNPAEATTRLDALKADSGWASRLTSGDVHAAKEYRELMGMIAEGGDKIGLAMAGAIAPEVLPSEDVRIMAGTTSALREAGVGDDVIRQALSGHQVTREEFRAVQDWRARSMKDETFVKALLSGDMEARQKMALAAIVISGGIKDQMGSF